MKIKLGIIAGEESGDQLGGSLIKELQSLYGSENLTIVGIGGGELTKCGLHSIFNMYEISLMGFGQVVRKLPKLIYYLRKTVNFFNQENIDCLIIIDSPDFTHRVAKKLKKIKPSLPIVQYVAPSVWAWRESRAAKMKSYIDELLVILPFEVELLKRLNGPRATYVGHQLVNNKTIESIYNIRKSTDNKNELLLLPGSRIYEIQRLTPIFCKVAAILLKIQPDLKISFVTLPHFEPIIKNFVGKAPYAIGSSESYKKNAFSQAALALAANGTVSLELALCDIPMVLCYKLDILAKYLIKPFIKIWSAALPNIIVDMPIVTEIYDDIAKPNILAKHLEYLLNNNRVREVQLAGFAKLRKLMRVSTASGKLAAARIAYHINNYRSMK